jgi:hypothetical protein
MSRGSTFISFTELVLDTNWTEVPLAEWGTFQDTQQVGRFLGAGWTMFKTDNGAAIEVLEPEVIRRAMRFRPKAILAVGYQMIRYQDADYEYELTVFEDEQLGRKKSPDESKQLFKKG